jgi:hypothetical protein
VFAIVFPIPVVIDDIDAAGDTAKGDEPVGNGDDLMKIKDLLAEK